MREFSSYGPVDKDLHYYAPRKKLLERAYTRLVGKIQRKGGHYITVWAPRQTGKSWTMREILVLLRKVENFDVIKLNLEHLKTENDVGEVLTTIGEEILGGLGKEIIATDTSKKFQAIFKNDILDKPLILIMDEFDALSEEAISAIVGAFRNIHNIRQDQPEKASGEKDYPLHGVALIGVRSVLGVENAKGSPFNVQRSLHIPNLTFEEVEGMFRWYEKESGQKVENEVIEKLFYETQGQPGLISWFGELLTEGWDQYTPPRDRPMNMADFNKAYGAATYALPNNNILNIISKAKQEPYKNLVLEMFKTDQKTVFKYDDPNMNFLYMNGVIEREEADDGNHYLKFPSPFVQKRLFNYFSHQMFPNPGKALIDPFTPLDNVINSERINIRNLMELYRAYLRKNRERLLKGVPRRVVDDGIYEAVFHFSLYSWLESFLLNYGAHVYPEFPTGNGKIDLLIKYTGKIYGLELKSYQSYSEYRKSLVRAARYGKELGITKISLIFFVERVDEVNRSKLEVDFNDPESGVKVEPIFVETEE